MSVVKIYCEHGECIEEVKEELIKAFSSNMDASDRFADPLMEELLEEGDSWYNFYFLEMVKKIIEVLSSDVD